MSNPIEHIFELDDSQLFVTSESLEKLLELDAPEINFIDELEDMEPDENGLIKIENLWWGGDDSDIDELKVALALTTGHSEMVIIYENGHVVGLKVDDGKITECDVSFESTPVSEEEDEGEP